MSCCLPLITFNEERKCCCKVGISVAHVFSTSSHISLTRLLMLLVCWRSWCYVSWKVGKPWICGRLCSSLGSKSSRVGKFITKDSLCTPWKVHIFQTIAPSRMVG
jgi:hypothetical protein